MDGDDLLVALRRDAVEGVVDGEELGQRGAGQLPRLQAAVDVRSEDGLAVGVFAVRAEDAQRDDKNGLPLPQLGGQVGAGVGQQCDFLGVQELTLLIRLTSLGRSYKIRLSHNGVM